MSKLLMQRVTWRVMALIGFESVLILSAVLLGTDLRLGRRPFEQGASDLALKGLLIALRLPTVSVLRDLYDSRVVGDRRELFVRLLQALGATSLILAAVYFWCPTLIIGRGVFMIAAMLVILFVVGLATGLRMVRRAGGTARAAAARGHQRRGGELAHEDRAPPPISASRSSASSYRSGRAVGSPVLNPRCLGTIEDIPAIVASRRSIAWWSAWRMRAASCRWTSCSR